jgi:Short C-terminal domain
VHEEVPEVTSGGHDFEARGAMSAPQMPMIRSYEQYRGIPFPLVDGASRTVGWQWRKDTKGGWCFATLRRTMLGDYKILQSFPLTRGGWEEAWEALVKLDPDSAEKARAELGKRQLRDAEQGQVRPAELEELDGRTLVCLPQMALLGGYAPDAPIAVGRQYDARFLQDRLVICGCGYSNVLAGVLYSEIEDVEIGGPGLVKSGGGFIGGGFGAVGALEGMAVAAVLNTLTTRTTITTVVRIQATNCELFLLWTKATPAQLRIELSRPLGAIRAARTADQVPARSASPVAELSKLADMLQAGLLTREEFDQLKAKLLQA